LSRPIGVEEHSFILGMQAAQDIPADFKKMMAELNAIPRAEPDVPVIQPLGSWSTYVRDPRLKSKAKVRPVT
jgi:hypothetical protein